jgi:alpha-beta hydrolase superfamily lysophospholipase
MTKISNQVYHIENTERGSKLFLQTYENPDSKVKAQMLLTHGLGEHSDVYKPFVTFLTQRLPLKVYSWDLYGHGRSTGQRGYVGDIDWFHQDLNLVLKRLDPKLPLVTFSHSLGGLIIFTAEQKTALFKGFDHRLSIFSNPCLGLKIIPPTWKEQGAHLLKIIAPRLTLSNEIKPEDLSSDTKYLEEHKKDSLKHTKISPRLFIGMQEWMSKNEAHNQTPPTATALSVKDPICDYTRSQLLLTKGKIKLFDNSKHEIINDIEKDAAYHQILEWIDEKI